MSVRAANADDAAAIEQISAAASSGQWRATDVLSSLGEPTRLVLVATDDGALCGFCVMSVVGDEAEVLEIATAVASRRRGHARALLAAALAAVAARGATRAFLDVRTRNAAALGLYESLGFAPVGRRRRYYVDDGDDAIIMARDVA